MANSKVGTMAGGPMQLPLQESGKVHQLTAIQERVEDALEVIEPAQVISDFLQKVSATPMPAAKPMTPEQIRLFCQAYNAGPYALLKHKGNVPYRETQNYFPRVMKYYQLDLSDSPYEPYILATAEKYAFDPQLIRAIIKTESDFNCKTVSHAGARGLMQVMPVVWKEIKNRYKFDWDYSSDVFDPSKNIEVSCAYLAWLRYDFLPKHFAEFEVNPPTPPALVRDRRLHPSSVRIVASVAAVSLPNNLGAPVKEMAEKAIKAEKKEPARVKVTVTRAIRAVKQAKAAAAARQKLPEVSDKKVRITLVKKGDGKLIAKKTEPILKTISSSKKTVSSSKSVPSSKDAKLKKPSVESAAAPKVAASSKAKVTITDSKSSSRSKSSKSKTVAAKSSAKSKKSRS